jgi:hypothetical protein
MPILAVLVNFSEAYLKHYLRRQVRLLYRTGMGWHKIPACCYQLSFF